MLFRSKAEKLIGKNAKHSAEPVLNLIKAAEAAQQRGDEFSANRYLIEATELCKRQPFRFLPVYRCGLDCFGGRIHASGTKLHQ